MVLAVKEDLDTVFYPDKLPEAAYNPQTPVAVRTMLFNQQFHSNKPKSFVAKVVLHTTPEGLKFFEVHLTPEGEVYVRARYSGGMYQAQTYLMFDPLAGLPAGKPKLKHDLLCAMHYLGLQH